jgi:hypothetical protein
LLSAGIGIEQLQRQFPSERRLGRFNQLAAFSASPKTSTARV